MSSSPTRPWVLAGLLLACLGEAVGFPLIKAFDLRAAVEAPGASGWFLSSVLLSGRFFGSLIPLLLLTRERPTPLEIAQGAWLGMFACAGHILLADGMNFTETSTSAFLSQGYVVLLPIFGALALRQWPARRIVVAVLISLVGLAVLARFNPWTLALGRGETEVLLSAFAFAGQIFSISRPHYARNRPGPVSLVMFATAGVCAVPVALATQRPGDFQHLTANSQLWLLLSLIMVCATLVPMWLMNRYQPYVSSAEAGVIYGAEPVLASSLALFCPSLLTPIAGAAYPNETLTPRLLVGGALIVLANTVLHARMDKDAELAKAMPEATLPR